MNSSVRGRRLASPVRVALAIELGTDLDGAWWPHTASVARELPELIDGLSPRLGQILDISVNWSSLEGAPDLDRLNRASTADPERIIGHQRLMMITGDQASTNLLVVPCSTSNVLALMVLRQAATLPVTAAERDTQAFRTAGDIVRAARAESAVCARRLRGAGRAKPTKTSRRRADGDTDMTHNTEARAIGDHADLRGSAPAATRIPSTVRDVLRVGAHGRAMRGEIVAAQSTEDSEG